MRGDGGVDLNGLAMFVAAAHAGSLSEGARRAGVPLPTLSRRIRRLEEELGTRLLDRGPRGLGLTPTGTRLLAEASPALDALSQAEQQLAGGAGVSGTLRVSMPPQLRPLWGVFARFQERHPAVRLDVFATDRRIDLVADGCDVALRVGEGGHGSYRGRTLVRYRHRVVATPELVATRAVAHPRDLADLPCACWRTVGPATWTLGGVEVSLAPVLVTNDYDHLLQVALSGAAVVEAPPFLVRDALQRGQLVEVLPSFPMPVWPMRALVVETRAMSPLVRAFLDHAADEVAGALGGGEPETA